MSKQQIATRTITVVPTANIPAKRGITRTGGLAGAGTSSAGESILCISDTAIDSGDAGRGVVGETAIAEAGAAIDGSVRTLKTDAQGRFIPTASGSDIVAAILMPGQTATAAGQFVEVMPVLY